MAVLLVGAGCRSATPRMTAPQNTQPAPEASAPNLSRLLYGFSTSNSNTRKKVDKALTSIKQGNNQAAIQHLQYAALDPELTEEERISLRDVISWLQTGLLEEAAR